MIRPHLLRELWVASPSHGQRAHHVSAASGLVAVGDFLYVVADDEHHLGVFPAIGKGVGELIRVFDGDLPLAHKARKAAKSDLEALTLVPPFAGYPSGALLLLGSGSTTNRCRGALLALDGTGAIAGEARAFDLGGLYRTLRRDVPALNIEGALISGKELILLQRGSRSHPSSALIRVPLDAMLAAAGGDGFSEHSEPAAIQFLSLGDVDGVPFGFTDGAALADGRIVFCAAAENARDTYQDGPCAGVAIGVLAPDGRVLRFHRVQPVQKIEGVAARLEDARIQLLLVTDADDATVPSQLLAVKIDSDA